MSPSPRIPGLRFFESLPLKWKLGLALFSWFIFLLGWQLLSASGFANPKLLPPPLSVADALIDLYWNRGFLGDVLVSLRRIFLSFSLAVCIALPIGLAMGCFSFADGLLSPLTSPFRYLPAPSFVPLLLMWLGTGESQKLALLFLGAVWFLIALLTDNTNAVSRNLVETAQTLGAKRRQVVFSIYFRAALPSYVDTIRQMLAVSWTYLVIAEIVAATDGIGAMMMRAKRIVRVDEIMAGILMIGFLGLVSDVVLRFLRWAVFPYARQKRQ